MRVRTVLLLAFAVVVAAPLAASRIAGQTADTPEHAAAKDAVTRAVAVLVPVGSSRVTGTIHFKQMGMNVNVTAAISGLTPGKHGFHIHQYGDLTSEKDGESAGGHFNPEKSPHGAPDAHERHVGDLGNIEANEAGVAILNTDDSKIQLNGPHSILGRSVVVHVGEDKFTQPTGNAGGRAAVGVIGIANPKSK